MSDRIRPVSSGDLPTLAGIYNHYVTHSVATLALEPIRVDALESAWRDACEQDRPWFVFEREARVCGYASVAAFKARGGYRHSLETTIYLMPDLRGQGVGRQLYQTLLDHPSCQAAHCLIAGISLPNEASVRLHESLGFKKVAHFPQVGRKFERWVDVGYWQRTQAQRALGCALRR